MAPLKVLTIHSSDVDPGLVQEVAGCLEQGGVVGLPTETVYGLCCRANQGQAVERIYAMKGRPSDKPLPFLIPDREAVLTYVNHVPRKAEKLMDHFWPGPLTLVLGPGAGVALRLPDHDFTRAVLRATAGPVLGTSANRSGEKPATTGRRVQRFFADHLDLLVDAGKSRLGSESTIVRVGDRGPAEVLRVGQLGEETIGATAATTILLVCTGNTCRSPMAAMLLRARLAERLQASPDRLERVGFRVLSAGIAAFPGTPMTREASEALHGAGIPAEDHQSRPLTSDIVMDADVIFVMTRAHAASVREQHPGAAGRVRLLDPLGDGIDDPLGGSREAYEQCLERIRQAIDARLPGLVAGDAESS